MFHKYDNRLKTISPGRPRVLPWQLHENAYISMACSDAPCDKRQGPQVAYLRFANSCKANLLQLLPRAIPGTTRLKLIILYGQKESEIIGASFDDIVKVTKSVKDSIRISILG